MALLPWEIPLFLLLRARMEILILGQGLWWFEVLAQKACRTAGHDICQGVGLASGSGIKECLTLFPWLTCNNDDLEILCKTGHACTHVDTQASSFYGHVTLGLRIHFPYLSEPSVSKTWSFINSCIHPSPFWAFEKISQHSPFRCRHIFLKNPCVWLVTLSKEKLESISFRKHVGFFS